MLNYLGYTPDAEVDAEVRRNIDRALAEVHDLANFQYLYAQFDKPLEFLQHPQYQYYLAGSTGYLLCATTLGVQIDRQLKRLQLSDMAYALIFDAAASAYLEYRAYLFEQELPFADRGFRFCPGYGGTSVADNREIAARLRAARIGITFLDSGLMVPMKSMTGIIRLGGAGRKSCAGCVAFASCTYHARGMTCWKV